MPQEMAVSDCMAPQYIPFATTAVNMCSLWVRVGEELAGQPAGYQERSGVQEKHQFHFADC